MVDSTEYSTNTVISLVTPGKDSGNPSFKAQHGIPKLEKDLLYGVDA
jgi:hypothetical protein